MAEQDNLLPDDERWTITVPLGQSVLQGQKRAGRPPDGTRGPGGPEPGLSPEERQAQIDLLWEGWPYGRGKP